MPETIAAPPAAPAPSAVSAPAPAASSPATPATPATPSTPAAAPAPPASTPAGGTPGAPATPAAPVKYEYNPETALAPPKQADYPDNVEGQERFVVDNGKWSLLHPEEADKLNRPQEAAPAAEAPKVEPEKPAEAAKPAESAAAAATPAVIEEWTGKSPELKAAFEKSPELQAAIMGMARDNEAAKPVLAITPTVEEATFNRDYANQLVGLESNWMLAGEDPEMVGPAWDRTLEMFKERDATGAEVKGADGKPKLAPDFKPFVRKAASTALDDFIASDQAIIDTLKARVAANPNDDDAATQLEQAQYNLAADNYILERLKANDSGLQLPPLPAGATPEQIAFQKKLEDQLKEANAKTGQTTTAERKAATVKLNREAQNHYESKITGYIETQVAAMKERGEYLPDFVLTDKWINPQTGKTTGLTDFGVKVYQKVNNLITSNPTHQRELARFEAMGAKGQDARKAALDKLVARYIPDVFNAEVKRIQDGIRGVPTAKSSAAVTPEGAKPGTPRVEPISGGTPVASGMSDDQMMTWARAEAQKEPGFAGMNAAQREVVVMTKYSEKKYYGV